MKKNDLSSQLKNYSVHKGLLSARRFWVKHFRSFLLLLFLLAIVFVGNVWYQNVYKIDKDLQERALHLEQRTKEVEFDENSFNEIDKRIDKRREEMLKNTESVTDIFFPNQSPTIAEDQKAVVPSTDGLQESSIAEQEEAVTQNLDEVPADVDVQESAVLLNEDAEI